MSWVQMSGSNVTDASQIEYNDSNVKDALDALNAIKASDIPIDAIAGLSAEDVQGALDEMKTLINNFSLSPKQIGAVVDIDTLKSGIVYVNKTSSNLPIAQWGWVVTLNDKKLADTMLNAGFQIFYSAQSNVVYTRYWSNNTWSGWTRLAAISRKDIISNVQITKVGDICSLVIRGWTKVSDFVIPEGYRPSGVRYFVGEQRQGTNSSYIGRVAFGTDGIMVLSGSGTEVIGTYTYTV